MENSEKEDQEHEIEKRLKRYLNRALILVGLLWGAIFISNIWLLYGKEDFNGGTLGDSFGVINGLFSGLAFAFLIYTAYMQKEELRLQRKELEDNRAELKRSADAHHELVNLTIAQNKLMMEQNKVMMNINSGGLTPEIEIFKSDIKDTRYTRVHMVVKYRSLTIDDFLDPDGNSLSEEINIIRPQTYENIMLKPSSEVVIEFKAGMEEFYIQYLTTTGDIYQQQFVPVGIGGMNIYPPEFVE